MYKYIRWFLQFVYYVTPLTSISEVSFNMHDRESLLQNEMRFYLYTIYAI